MLPNDRPTSALPSVGARVLAFVAIIVAGLAGAAIGGSVVNIDCHGSCGTPIGLGAVVGGAGAAGGTGVVAALTLRAMGEWKRISEDELGVPPVGPGYAGEGGSPAGGGPPGGGPPGGGSPAGGPPGGGSPADEPPAGGTAPGDSITGSGEGGPDQDGISSRNPSA